MEKLFYDLELSKKLYSHYIDNEMKLVIMKFARDVNRITHQKGAFLKMALFQFFI